MKYLLMMLIAALLGLWANQTLAELNIEITQGVDNPTEIAIVPFGGPNGTAISNIIKNDLYRSGQFAPLAEDAMLSLPQVAEDVHFRDWRSTDVDFLLIGRVIPEAGQFKVQYSLFDVYSQKSLLSKERVIDPVLVRGLSHRIADDVYKQLTGIRGAFSTRLLYVSSIRNDNNFTYRLVISDIDGANERIVLEQGEPILTPTWSPNGQQVAYVSFETSRPAIYIHNLVTGQRTRLTNFKGLNSAPAWSPDGKRMAMVLSKDGGPDIYVMDIASRRLNRLTTHYAIDTEPSWMPDGHSIVFTSDRGGKPQIYQVGVHGGKPKRLTFDGRYNARARVLPDGSGMVLVHQRNKQFQIALMNFSKGTIEILTRSSLDESPSIAPNGTMLLYATQQGGRQILSAVSLDGGVTYNLPASYGDVREPAWSPFPKQ